MTQPRSSLAIVLAALAPLALPPDARAQDVVRVRGVVLEEGSALPLAGARVTALDEGVFAVQEAYADEAGAFELLVHPGTYDVRAVAAGHVAETVRELAAEEARGAERSFALVPYEVALEARGIAPELLLDGDGDFVPDHWESVARTDPALADSDDDGLSDGADAWLAGDPRSPVRPAQAEAALFATPQVLQLASTPGSVLPPVGLRFAAVPGATGYLLELIGKNGAMVRSQRFDFEAGELVVGEGVVAAWEPGAALAEGAYTLKLSAFRLEPQAPVGRPFQAAVSVSAVLAEPLEVREETALAGRHVAREVRVFSGATLRIPDGSALELVSLGHVVVEPGGRIVGGAGASLVVRCGGDLVVQGLIAAGDGARPGSARTLKHAHGGAGGELMVFTRGTVSVASTGALRSGRGGDGAVARKGEAGDGGKGGDLILIAAEIAVADRPGRIDVGSGGRGADGLLPGLGGPAGDVWLSHWSLRGDRFVDPAHPEFPLQGGVAGAPGTAQPTPGGTFRDQYLGDGRAAGGGWLRGGDGAPVVAHGRAGRGSGRGGAASAQAGAGGNVRRLGLSRRAFGCVFGFVARGGDGGLARAVGGAGGESNANGRPGDGGDAQARGGAGGRGLGLRVAQPSAGGTGGPATAQGGAAQPGVSRCDPPAGGGMGTMGGSANATGGPGGDGGLYGGDGGAASANGADGGDGGDGRPPGRGGWGGDGKARGGKAGNGTERDGARGGAQAQRGVNGERGDGC